MRLCASLEDMLLNRTVKGQVGLRSSAGSQELDVASSGAHRKVSRQLQQLCRFVV
jgi:hypothetical protein